MPIWAHRGSSLIWPENTALAFRLAHQSGATGFETDLRLSKDGEIMLCHDAALGRFGLPSIVVADRRAAELEDIEIASLDGLHRDRLMRLETLLASYPDQDYIFDCKIDEPALFDALAELLARRAPRRMPWFLTWSEDGDRQVVARFPEAPLFPREPATRRWGFASVVGLGRFTEPARSILSLPVFHHGWPVVSRRQIASIEARGKTFLGFLVNTERDFRRARAIGVHSILTDRPDLAAGPYPAPPLSR